MKKSIIVVSALLFLAAQGCDVLDKEPLDSISTEQYFSNANAQALEQYCNDLYPKLITGHGDPQSYNFGMMETDFQSDDLLPWDANSVAFSQHTVSTDDGDNWKWENIRACNAFLADYEKSPASEEDKHHYAGEILFFKTLDYFNKVKRFGDVPWYDEVLTPGDEGLYKARDSRVTVMNNMLRDINQAIEWLPTKATTGVSRVSKDAALALKARAALYRASKLFNTSDDKSLWKEAALASRDVIDYCADNGITLGKYTDLWGTDNYKASEVIFARRIGDTATPEYENFPIGMENAGSGNCPTQTLVDAYEMQNGGEPNPSNPYAGRDPRFKMTIACNGDKWPDTNPTPLETYVGGKNGAPIPYASPTGYYLKKYLDGSIDISAGGSTGGKRHSWITFRLGEFLLDYAEVLFQYTGSADEVPDGFRMSAREAVNLVRARQGVNMPAFPEAMSPSDFWKRYKRERMVELAFEGHRFWDVRRWKEGGFTSITRMQITRTSDGRYTYTRIVQGVWINPKSKVFNFRMCQLRLAGHSLVNQ